MISFLSNNISKIRSNEVALNTAWQFFERFFGLGCSFISSIFVIRYFAPAEYGIFAYASSYVTLFSALCTMGLQSIVVREMIKKEIPTEEIMGSSFVIMLIGAIIATIIAICGAIYSHEKSLTRWVILILCLINIINSFAVINYYFQAEIKSRYVAYVMLVQDIADICIKLTLVHLKAGIISFALIGLGESIFTNVIIYLIFHNYSKLKSWKFTSNTIKFLFHQSLPLAISGVMIGLYMRLDQVMIEYYCGTQAVAQYNVGIKIVEMFYIIPMVLLPNILPRLIQIYTNNRQEFKKLFSQILNIFTFLSLTLIAIIYLTGEKIILLLYGSKYIESGIVVKPLSILILPIFIGILFSGWLQIKGLQKYSLYFTITGLSICLLLNFILIPRYGIIGAAYAIISAQCIPFIWYVMLYELRAIFDDISFLNMKI